jgi:GAF domain-containing protein
MYTEEVDTVEAYHSKEAIMSGSSPQLIRFLQQENSRLAEDNETLRAENQILRRYMEALQELHRATQQITTEENLIKLLNQILINAMTVLMAEGGSLALLDDETNELVFVVVHGDISDQLRNYRIKSNQGVAGWVASHREPLIVNNPRQDYRFSPEIDKTFNFFTRSILCVPLITGNKLIGVIQLLNRKDDEPFSQTDMILLSILSYVAATALEEMRLQLEAEEELQQESQKAQAAV